MTHRMLPQEVRDPATSGAEYAPVDTREEGAFSKKRLKTEVGRAGAWHSAVARRADTGTVVWDNHLHGRKTRMSFASSSLVSTDWLEQHLNDTNIVILDGSFKLPGMTPLASEDYETRHIPGAVFFDIDAVADHSTTLPHMLPSAAAFAKSVEALGVYNDSFVVAYDTPGLMSASRVWWTFRMFGHRNVAVLDGGLKAWLAEGRPVTASKTIVRESKFKATLDRSGVVTKSDVLKNVETRERTLVDARSAARFNATEKEARPGLRSGHIPDSLNVPFNLMTDPDTGRMKSPREIRAIFEQAGLDMAKPAIASCGSGVTACALVFGLHLAGKDDVAVYDGAWTEWGMLGDTPVEP